MANIISKSGDEVARLTLTVAEVAKVLGLSRQSVYTAIKAGEIPSLTIGHRCLVPRKALERMLEAQLAEASK